MLRDLGRWEHALLLALTLLEAAQVAPSCTLPDAKWGKLARDRQVETKHCSIWRVDCSLQSETRSVMIWQSTGVTWVLR